MYRVSITDGDMRIIVHNTREYDPKLSGRSLAEGINTFPSFSFTIFPDNPGYEYIESMKTLITVRDLKKREDIFEGRVLSITDNIDESGRIWKEVVCEGEMAYLCDSVQVYRRYTSGTITRYMLADLLAEHNSQVDKSKQFTLGECWLAGLPEATEVEGLSTWEAMKAFLLDKIGGEFRVRKVDGVRYLDYLETIGKASSTEIKLAVNLKSLTRSRDLSGLVTRVIPLGARLDTNTSAFQPRLTIVNAEKSGGKNYIDNEALVKKYGIIEGVVIFDGITDPDELYERGKEHADGLTDSAASFQITALDLSKAGLDFEEFELGNWHAVKNWIMGINESLRIVGKTTDLDNPQNSALTVGSKFETLTAQTSRQSGYQQMAAKMLYSQNQINAILSALGGLKLSPITRDSYDKTADKKQNTIYLVDDGDHITPYLGEKIFCCGGEGTCGGSTDPSGGSEQFEQGTINTNGSLGDSRTRIRMKAEYYLDMPPLTDSITVSATASGDKQLMYAISGWQTTGDFYFDGPWTAVGTPVSVPMFIRKFAVLFMYADESPITPDELKKYSVTFSEFGGSVVSYQPENMIISSMNDSTGQPTSSSTRLACTDYIETGGASKLAIAGRDNAWVGSGDLKGYAEYAAYFYRSDKTFIKGTDWTAADKYSDIPSDAVYFRFILRHTNNSSIDQSQIDSIDIYLIQGGAKFEIYDNASDSSRGYSS